MQTLNRPPISSYASSEIAVKTGRPDQREQQARSMPLKQSTEAIAATEDDLLWRHLKSVPAFRALLRSVEARLYQQISLPEPILDLGCGDGHFASLTFSKKLAVGIDPWWRPLRKARRSGAYHFVIQGLGDVMPFPEGHFASVISNSVLEHIPDVQSVLNESFRVIKPGGRLVITFPSDNFTTRLGGALWLERRGLTGLADRYRHAFNYIARHAHTDSDETWARRLSEAGFIIERRQAYFSDEALHALEAGHFLGIPSLITHLLTRRWIIGPWRGSLFFTERWLRPLYAEPYPTEGTMLLFIAQKPAGNHRRDDNSTFGPGRLEVA